MESFYIRWGRAIAPPLGPQTGAAGVEAVVAAQVPARFFRSLLLRGTKTHPKKGAEKEIHTHGKIWVVSPLFCVGKVGHSAPASLFFREDRQTSFRVERANAG